MVFKNMPPNSYLKLYHADRVDSVENICLRRKMARGAHLPTSYPPLHTYKNLTPLTSSNTQLQQPSLSSIINIINHFYYQF